jgi:hypothetical protein
MHGVALLLLQTATPAPDTQLLHPVPPAHCQPSPNEITVCGQDPDRYRLPKTGPMQESAGLPKAEWRLFGDARMDVHATQRALAPAVMVTVKIPF